MKWNDIKMKKSKLEDILNSMMRMNRGILEADADIKVWSKINFYNSEALGHCIMEPICQT